MRRKYIVFYAFTGGYGSTDIKVSRKESPDKLENIRKIEKSISDELNTNVSLINYKKAGLTWR